MLSKAVLEVDCCLCLGGSRSCERLRKGNLKEGIRYVANGGRVSDAICAVYCVYAAERIGTLGSEILREQIKSA